MLEFSFFRAKVCFSFSFFAVLGLLLEKECAKYVLLSLFCCVFHELGHIIAMVFFKIKIRNITFYGGGIKINREYDNVKSYSQERLVLVFGCIFNLLLSVVTFLFYRELAVMSFAIGVFNLLPFSYLDGGLIFQSFLEEKDNKLLKIIYYAFLVLASILLICVFAFSFINSEINFSLFITVFYIFISELLI